MADRIENLLQSAYEDLIKARDLLRNEIDAYPGPIAGCDVQFNHLLAEREKVSGALRSLEGTVFVPTPRSPYPFSGVEAR